MVENWKVNVVYLVEYPRIELLPNFSIKCLLIESWLKIKNIQFYVNNLKIKLKINFCLEN